VIGWGLGGGAVAFIHPNGFRNVNAN
jgi:hypothetical protein